MFRGTLASARVIVINGIWWRKVSWPGTESVKVAPGLTMIGVDVWSVRHMHPPDRGFACVPIRLKPATNYEFHAIVTEGDEFELQVTESFGDLRDSVATVRISQGRFESDIDACH